MTFGRATAHNHDAASPPQREADCLACAPEAAFALERQLGNDVIAARAADPLTATVERGLSAGGRPLDAAVRSSMEPRFGHDLGHVRLHDDAAAAQSADALGAAAYTIGGDVVLGGGADLDSPAGQGILAHELTHVVQRGARAPTGPLSLSGPSAAEREADAVGAGLGIRVSAPLGPSVVARQAKVEAPPILTMAEKLTVQQILEAWNLSKGNVLEFKQRLFGQPSRAEFMTDEYLQAFLRRKGFPPPSSEPEPEPDTGPAWEGPREGEPFIERDILFTDPGGGTVKRRMRGTKAMLDKMQYDANLEAGHMMVQGLWGAMRGMPRSVRPTSGMPGARPAAIMPPSPKPPAPAPPPPSPAPPAPVATNAPPAPKPAPPPPTPAAGPPPPRPAPPAVPKPVGREPKPAVPPPPPAPKPGAWATPSSKPAQTLPNPFARKVPEGPSRPAPPPAPPGGDWRFHRGRLEVSQWPQLRADALRRDPTCAFCQTRSSVTGDHVEPLVDVQQVIDAGMMTHEEARQAANNPANLRGICKPCNDSKQGKPAGDPRVDPRYWEPPNPDARVITHMQNMRRWPF